MEDRKSLQHILVVCTIASFLTPFIGSSVNLSLVDLQKDLNGNQVLLNWVVMSFLLASAAFLLPFGSLADLKGRRGIFVKGLGLFALASMGCGLAPSMEILIACRVVQGIGAAMMFATSMAIISFSFPLQERGRVLGIISASVYSGLALGPVLGGLMTHYLGWRSLFWMVAVLALPTTIAAVKCLPDDRRSYRLGDYDFPGAVIITLSLVLITYGAATFTSQPAGPYLNALGIVGLICFWYQEKRAARPLLEVRAFSGNKTFVFANLASLLNYSATFAITFLMSLYLQAVRGMGEQEAGLILLVQPVMMTLVSPLAGRMSDRYQPRVLATAGMGITAAGTFLLTSVQADTGILNIIALLAIMGAGFGLFASPNNNAIMSSVEKHYFGVASSMLGTMRLVGQAMSMAIVAFVFAHFLGPVKISPEIGASLLTATHTALTVFGALLCLGIAASMTGSRKSG